MDLRVLRLLLKKKISPMVSPMLILCGFFWMILAAPIPITEFKLFKIFLGESLAFYVFYVCGFIANYNMPVNKRLFWSLPIYRRTLSTTVWFGSIGIPILQILLFALLEPLIFQSFYIKNPAENLVPAFFISVLVLNLTYSITLLLYSANRKKILFGLILLALMIGLGVWTTWNFEQFRDLFHRHYGLASVGIVLSFFASVYSAKESEAIPPANIHRLWKPKADNARTEFAWSPLWRSIRCNPFYMAVFFSFILSSIASLLLCSVPVLANLWIAIGISTRFFTNIS